MAKDESKKKRKSDAMDVDAPGTPEVKKSKKDKKEKKDKENAEGVVVAEGGEKKEKKEKKDKKEKASAYDVPLSSISPISSPLAHPKLSKKIFRTIKKSSKARQLKRGVKEVIKSLRKGEKGLLVLASNITPLDVISHLPVLAEETEGVEYCWVLSKEELGASAGTKRATSCVLICSNPRKRPTPKAGAAAKPPATAEEIKEWQEPLLECIEEVKGLDGQQVIV